MHGGQEAGRLNNDGRRPPALRPPAGRGVAGLVTVEEPTGVEGRRSSGEAALKPVPTCVHENS
jgi:hypothetical protein